MTTDNQTYNLVALLPMKAHSARVKGKNFRTFANKPLFKWILETLLSLSEIEKVVINTDARNILAENGLSDTGRILVRDRKSELCGDYVSMNKILGDDVANVKAKVYIMTHTTNPLLSGETIRAALNKYYQKVAVSNCDSLFTVNKYQTRFYKQDGTPINHDPDNLVRTQDLEPYYEENSNLYIFSEESFRLNNARIGNRPALFETPRMESCDIDDQVGWTIAELVALSRQIVEAHSRE